MAPSFETIRLTDEQQKAFGGIVETLMRGGRQSVLHGLAGTGKTTVVAQIAQKWPRATLVALTGKAASMLRVKTGLPARTIHGAIYQRIEVVPGGARFKRRLKDGQLRGHLIIIDECSMVDEAMAADIIRSGASIVACGDPGQLPPLIGEPFFNKPDQVLHQIHRQALESPIIRQAHAVRCGNAYRNDGAAFRVADQPLSDDLLAADVVLCHRNATRHQANRWMRTLRGYSGHPQQGEPALCLRNARNYDVFNGCVYELARDFRDGASDIYIKTDGGDSRIPNARFEGVKPPPPMRGYRGRQVEIEVTTSFDFGYALTVHKSQGSEWTNVVLIDEYCFGDNRRQWLYTGITRASEQITITGALRDAPT